MARLPNPVERPWLSVKELSEATGEGEKVLRAAIESGHLPSVRIGRYVRVPTAPLLEMLGIREVPDPTSDGTEPDLGRPVAALLRAPEQPSVQSTDARSR